MYLIIVTTRIMIMVMDMIMILRPISLLTLHPTNIARLKLSGKHPMGLGIPSLKIKIMLESNPLKPTMLVGRLGVMILGIFTSEDGRWGELLRSSEPKIEDGRGDSSYTVIRFEYN